ncbi:transcriptional regulator [Candidatus Roizmanbacteria bacterium CG11_big_fil_rev_8_21_14_0_20_36_8]|uniref:Transcriptional regulator n=2 Tax=Candidatus Roizmaniibacteriota TaxID=1752723 RepID=A0A2M6IU90_9BACT|nr:MAG: transcriptional regulator [Candidatus Roizmanbacteria bacterium CG11_big_fil_rev_8_21_14_0_20_36_8]PIZ64512.1 MAG: transcriptional regulator [Candidatus Roizmanbacteria bacterium CG_4_10_14_0_2_um_filter_36_9]
MENPDQIKIREEIGRKIKQIRTAKELTQSELATLAGVSENYFAMIERGEVNFTFDKLFKIIKALKVKSSQILPF